MLVKSSGAAAVQANAEVVRTAVKSPQASVRQCAMRVFKLLGGDTLPEAAQPAAGSAAAAAAVPDLMTDLLGEADMLAAAPASQDFLGMLLGPHQQACPLFSGYPKHACTLKCWASCLFDDPVLGACCILLNRFALLWGPLLCLTQDCFVLHTEYCFGSGT